MFGRATIRLGIGPHSSYYSFPFAVSEDVKTASRSLFLAVVHPPKRFIDSYRKLKG